VVCLAQLLQTKSPTPDDVRLVLTTCVDGSSLRVHPLPIPPRRQPRESCAEQEHGGGFGDGGWIHGTRGNSQFDRSATRGE